MPEIRNVDGLKSGISIKRGETVSSPTGQPRISSTSWDPSAGLEAEQRKVQEALDALAAQRAAERQYDPTQIRLSQLEAKVDALVNLVKPFVEGTSVNG